MKIFVSSNSEHTWFVNPTLDAINEKSEQLKSAINYTLVPIFPPWNIGTSNADLLGKVLEIKASDIVFMNITPEIIREDKFFINSGVLIEFGVIAGTNEFDKLHVFCADTFDRSNVSPLFHGFDIKSFKMSDNSHIDLKEMEKTIIDAHIRKVLSQAKPKEMQTKSMRDFISYTATSSTAT